MKNIPKFETFINESGISYDDILDDVFAKTKRERNWEPKAEKELKKYGLTKNQTLELMNMLRGEDYFDTGEIDLGESTNENNERQRKSYVEALIKKQYSLSKSNRKFQEKLIKVCSHIPKELTIELIDSIDSELQDFYDDGYMDGRNDGSSGVGKGAY